MKTVPVGKEDFKKLIESDSYYVDKTRIIEELRENNIEVVLFPRPRRFGKTLTMSMIEHFFDIDKKDDNKNLFKGLYIETSPYYRERGEYPVISLSFKGLVGKEFSNVYNMYVNMMVELYNSKEYIYDTLRKSEQQYFDLIRNRQGKEEDFILAISTLTKYLERYHHKKVIVLIDEYDIPIQDGYLKGYYDDIIEFIRGIFINALKTNNSILFSVLTGVLRVSKESLFSGFNNVEVLGIINSPFGEYFGFTESETKELLEYCGLKLTDEVKEMYDGYNFNGVEVYNPWSVLNYAKNKILSPYWLNTSGNKLIKKIIFKTKDENRKVIEDLANGESYLFTYDENITYKDYDEYNNINIILNLFFASGYLTVDEIVNRNAGKAKLKVPNKEVKKLIMNSLAESILGNKTYLCDDINDAIESYDMIKLEKILNQVLMSFSTFDSEEAFYHGSVLGLFAALLDSDYIIESNSEAGNGRCDILLENKDRSLGYIFEFKFSKDNSDMESIAGKALKQIETKEYYQRLVLDKVSDIKKVSVVFKKKKCIVRI